LFLEEFKRQSDKLEAEKSPTIQIAALSRHVLLKHGGPKREDSAGLKNLRARSKVFLEEKFVLNETYKLGTFFWPKYRRLMQLNEEERLQVLPLSLHEVMVSCQIQSKCVN